MALYFSTLPLWWRLIRGGVQLEGGALFFEKLVGFLGRYSQIQLMKRKNIYHSYQHLKKKK